MNQTDIELLMHPKHIVNDIKQDILDSFKEDIDLATRLIEDYLDQDYWESKNLRLAKLKALKTDIPKLVLDILTQITIYCEKPMILASVLGLVNIKGLDKIESYQTIGEFIILLRSIELYTLTKRNDGSYIVQSTIELTESLYKRLKLHCYLPPMTVRPKYLTRNNSCGYKTITTDSLILGNQENYHTENICLDVLNTLAQTVYELDKDFLAKHSKQWFREELEPECIAELNIEAQQQYHQDIEYRDIYLEQFEVLKNLIIDKPIYFNYKVDKRGRVYSQGYHFNPQGSSFEKASLNLKTKETVKGEL